MNNDELLLTSILQCSLLDLKINPPVLNLQQEIKFQEMKIRLAQGEPIQYVLGDWDFINTNLEVNPQVLIPRPETELMVEYAFKKLKDYSAGKALEILDLGTGSGNIAIALAKNLPHCHVTAVDISLDAISLARQNARRNDVSENIFFVCVDMREFLARRENAGKFHVIISNPPYIPTKKLNDLPSDVKREPWLAFDGGEDGLDFYRVIIGSCPILFKSEGFLLCEFWDGQKDAIEDLLRSSNAFSSIIFEKDYTQTHRFFCAQIKSKC